MGCQQFCFGRRRVPRRVDFEGPGLSLGSILGASGLYFGSLRRHCFLYNKNSGNNSATVVVMIITIIMTNNQIIENILID